MDEILYDEFGNYIGKDLDEFENESDDASENYIEHDVTFEPEEVGVRTIVAHEEKEYYPDAQALYGDAEVLIQEEDSRPLSDPILAPHKTKDFDILEKNLPETSFNYDFLVSLMDIPESIRFVCFLGHFHSGKTSLMDILVNQTHAVQRNTKWDSNKPLMYTDSRKDEVERGLSVKAIPISLVLPSTSEKSYLFHFFDTPGHVNFQDECTAAMRLCDGAILVIDALSGVMCNTEKLLQHALQEGLSITIVINCIDRLILELRLPPADAYFKIRHILSEVNSITESFCKTLGLPSVKFSPAIGNVAFASGLHGFIFTLKFFAKKYIDDYQNLNSMKGGWMRGLSDDINIDHFVKCLWGDVYCDINGSFTNKPPTPDSQRTFVEFVLNPLYKIFAHTVSEEQVTLEPLLQSLGIYLKKKDFLLDSKSLLGKVCKLFFGGTHSLVDMLVEFVPNPKANAVNKVSRHYTGNMDTNVANDMKELSKDPKATLVIHTTKNYHRPDCNEFDVLGRIMSGTVYKGQKVKILRETYTLEDTEDSEIRHITQLWIYQGGRYRVEMSSVCAGNLVLIGGCSQCINKTSTITNAEMIVNNKTVQASTAEVEIYAPLKFYTKSVICVSCEPLNPSELPKMLEGFRKVSRAYPLCQTKVEESGEHVILGTGELYMDCVLHDLRKLYGDLEIKVADPVVQFCESVVETSMSEVSSHTPNKKNMLKMITEPLEKGLGESIEKGVVKFQSNINTNSSYPGTETQLSSILMSQFNWDILAARSVWAFGPDNEGPNILIDDVLPTFTDKKKLNRIKNHIIQGFQWVCREGPLIEELVRDVKFRLLEAVIADEPTSYGAGQIIPTTRRIACASILSSQPRLVEPVLLVEIECPADCVSAVYTVLAKRRGYVAKDSPKPGTPLYSMKAYLPAIESFGFETDLRSHTSGQAFCLSLFDHWELVPGDPLDKSIVLRTLEPAPIPHLAREFLLKTRRRKGLSENVNVHIQNDDQFMIQMPSYKTDSD